MCSFRLISDTLDRIKWCYYEYKISKHIWSYYSGLSIYYVFSSERDDIKAKAKAMEEEEAEKAAKEAAEAARLKAKKKEEEAKAIKAKEEEEFWSMVLTILGWVLITPLLVLFGILFMITLAFILIGSLVIIGSAGAMIYNLMEMSASWVSESIQKIWTFMAWFGF